ncbi:hypothetical protein BFP72_13200 [Reichenbachiella sp. 5M10]|nr:hypothetical protein BFP72_13200 [Reichenbachiella sp. 5M10]
MLSILACSDKDPNPNSKNTPPTAHAGRLQNVATGTQVTLDGSGSTDEDRDPLSFSWSMASKPESSSASLSASNTSHPTFTADVDGEYTIQLIVNDGTADSSPAIATVTATSGNVTPVAHAGADQNITAGTEVNLDGSSSSDADGDNLTFAWTIVTSPTGSTAALSEASTSHPTFTADVDGTYLVTLQVHDGTITSVADTVQITATHTDQNALPIADAGADRSVHTGTQVSLDASGSSDADSNTLSYSWHLSSVPAGSSASLNDTTLVNPMITPDIEGAYVLSLVVNDGTENSAPDFVTIQATTFSAKEQLINMGIDASDADYLIANHSDDVQTVLNDQDRIFKDMPALDNMFALPSDPAAAAFADPQMTTWSNENKVKFQKMFGRFVFVINSPKFMTAFNTNIGLLNPAYQGQAPAVPFPTNYSQFRADANAALIKDQYQYKFFISNRESWTAWGQAGLHLKVENIMFGPPTDGAPHNTEALILHEITHTWGYAHDGPDAEVTLKPNNIPYYVQFLVGNSYKDPAAAPVWNTPDALLTIYFGNP